LALLRIPEPEFKPSADVKDQIMELLRKPKLREILFSLAKLGAMQDIDIETLRIILARNFQLRMRAVPFRATIIHV
jgi:metal-sulfur cluster biosynthetic enzyme